jgi:hypothetical protein
LRLNGAPPYFWELTLSDNYSFSTTASFGALLGSSRGHSRVPRFFARVGSYELDNTNYFLSGRLADFRLTEEFPEDDNVPALRHAIWLLMDRAFRDASIAIRQKETAIANLASISEALPDFSRSNPATVVRETPRVVFSGTDIENRVRVASAIMSKFPKVEMGTVEAQINEAAYYSR